MNFDVTGGHGVEPGQLRRAPMFSSLSEETLSTLGQSAELRIYERDETLFSAGEHPEYLHILIKGSVQLGATSEEREAVVELLRPVDAFLMAAVFTGQPYLMSAKALTTAHILQIPSQALLRQMTADPQLGMNMLGSLAQHYRQMVRQVKNLRLRTAAQRLALYLLHLVESDNSGRSTTLPYDKRLLAAHLDMTPESLSRSIADLRKHGVDVRKDQVSITDLEKLRAFCRLDQVLDALEADLKVIAPQDD